MRHLLLLCLLAFGLNGHALEFMTTESNGVQYIMINGVFDDTLTTNIVRWGYMKDELSLRGSFKDALSKGKPIAVMITSEGGSREAAKTIAVALKKWAAVYAKRTHSRLYVGLIGQCPSACTFLAAELNFQLVPTEMALVTPSDTPFLFHGPRDFETGEMLSREDFDMALADGLTQYLSSGVNKSWLDKHKSIFRRDRPDGVTFKASQLCGNKSQILPREACVPSYLEIEKRLQREASTATLTK